MPENLIVDLYLNEDDLPPMPALEGDEEVELEPEEPTAERVKLNPPKKKRRNRIKNINSKQTVN